MDDAEIARRSAPIKAAFASAVFDERTPDEKGFADVFEKELKPKLIEGVDAALKRELEGRKGPARLIIGCASVMAFLVVFTALTIAGKDASLVGNAMAVLAVAFVAWMGLAANFKGSIFARSMTAFLTFFFVRDLLERSPVREFVVERLLRQFGCRLGGTTDMFDLMKSPIRPRWSDVRPQSVSIEGAFDGRLHFKATRVYATERDGKETHTAFHGWYLAIDLPFSFNGTTTVRAGGASVRYADGKELGELVLEDPEFSRKYVAQTDDQVEARIIFSPDVIHHVASVGTSMDRGEGHLLMGFSGSRAHIWFPWKETAFSSWQPLHPPKLIEGLHGMFIEMAEIRAFLRDIDVIAESEGFRAQAARNVR